MPSIKLHLETVPNQDEPIKELSKSKVISSNGKVGRIVHEDKLNMDVNVKFDIFSTPAKDMEMNQTLSFKDQSAFEKECRKQLKLFSAHPNVAAARKKDNFRQIMRFEKTDFMRPLPDYVIESIAKILIEEKATTELSFAKKNTPFSVEQTKLLVEKMQHDKNNLPLTANSNKKFLSACKALLFIGVVTALLSLTMQASFLTYLVLGSVIAFALNKGLNFLLDVNARSYNTPDKIKAITNVNVQKALYAGCAKGLLSHYTHLMHPLALLAGFKIRQDNNAVLIAEIEKFNPQPNVNVAQVVPVLPPTQRDLCLKAILNRNNPKPIIVTPPAAEKITAIEPPKPSLSSPKP